MYDSCDGVPYRWQCRVTRIVRHGDVVSVCVNGAKGDKGTDKIATEDFAESEVVLESAP